MYNTCYPLQNKVNAFIQHGNAKLKKKDKQNNKIRQTAASARNRSGTNNDSSGYLTTWTEFTITVIALQDSLFIIAARCTCTCRCAFCSGSFGFCYIAATSLSTVSCTSMNILSYNHSVASH